MNMKFGKEEREYSDENIVYAYFEFDLDYISVSEERFQKLKEFFSPKTDKFPNNPFNVG